MPQQKDKYSLWIVPKGEAGKAIQALIDTLADENNSPRFVPHLTLVANIFADRTELEDVKRRIKQSAGQIRPFTVSLTGYGYMEEEFRSLYLLADGEGLRVAYEALAAQFPKVSDEHFQAMPHISVLYGQFPQDLKNEIIAANPLAVTEFTVDAFDLYLTNNPVESWRLLQSFPLQQQRTPLATSKNNISVWYDPIASHAATHIKDEPGLVELAAQIVGRTDITEPYMQFHVDVGRTVGTSDLVETDPGDEIVYAKRQNRDTYTVFNKSKQAQPCSLVAVALEMQEDGTCALASTWIGPSDFPSFPGSVRETADSKEFWSKHSLVWGNQEIQPGSETTDYPFADT